ncbi:MAG: hypothetical protein ABJU46_15285 [Paracoccaceae bacterium]
MTDVPFYLIVTNRSQTLAAGVADFEGDRSKSMTVGFDGTDPESTPGTSCLLGWRMCEND